MLKFIVLFTLLAPAVLLAQESITQDSIEITTEDTVFNQSVELPNEVKSSIDELYNVDVANLSVEPKKKRFSVPKVHILIGLDYSYLNPFVMEKDIYQGPLQPNKDEPAEWIERNTKTNVAQSNRAGNFQFNLQANFWKGLFVGMNYHFFTIRNYKKEPNKGNLFSKSNSLFFLVSANFGYVFEFLKNKSLQIHPTLKIGGYTADGYYDSGKGRKFYLGSELKIRYLIKRKFGIGVGVGYDYLYYKQKELNDQFQRTAYQKTTFNNIHLNAGFSYNITIRTKQ